MNKIWTLLWYTVYAVFAKYLPCSYARVGGHLGRAIRYQCAKRMFMGCGTKVNLEQGVSCGRRIWIGNYSDLGIRCQVYGELHVGNHTFMGPDVVIYTENHRFDDLQTPMMHQGLTPRAACLYWKRCLDRGSCHSATWGSYRRSRHCRGRCGHRKRCAGVGHRRRQSRPHSPIS